MDVFKDFVHLHVHSAFSLLDGMITPARLAKRARELGMSSIALTDHGNMFGILEFYNECKKPKDKDAKPIKPILGCEVYIAPVDRTIKKSGVGDDDENYYHLILLAKDLTGYRNLLKIVSDAWLVGKYYKPRTDKSVLRQYSEGIIALSSCLGGEIPSLLKKNDVVGAEKAAYEYFEIFKGDFYLEMQNNSIPEQWPVNRGLADIGRKLGIPLVATNDIHFLNKEDSEAHRILLGVGTKKTVSEMDAGKGMKLPAEVYFTTQEEMCEAFKDYPDAIMNTKKIADMCNVDIDMKTLHFPKFPVPDGYTLESFFEERIWEGLKERFTEITPAIKERTDFEIKTIKDMKFPGYFLIVWDFIKYAKEHGIPVGPGRGSAAGSIVSYALRITDVDPLKHDLLFERFLNPARLSMPDIDIDFADDRREEVVQYVRQKYGDKNVSQIAAIGYIGAKTAIRDIARVLEIPLSEANMIAKLIPGELDMTLDKAFKDVPELAQIERSNPMYAKLFSIAKKLEGIPRQASKHPAGVVIADTEISNYVPLFMDKDDNVVSQLDKDWVEKVGLIKMDFLGLRTLSVIRDALEEIEKHEGIKIDINHLDINDKKVYSLLQKGYTIGVFQMEKSGFTKVLINLKPTEFEDIIALLALYRPGPLNSGMVDSFIKRKHKKEEVDYQHPNLKGILKETYGVIVYQEQVMQITQVMSGFDLAQADNIRRVISKKKAEDMAQARKQLLEGAQKKGFDVNVADKIISNIEKFAEYGFNKSHSAAYAYVAYQTAWLKTYYPVEFIAALLTNEMGDTVKVIQVMNECKLLKIKVLRPDINHGAAHFTVQKDENGNKVIAFCLAAIKGVGEKAVENIVHERETNGLFKSLVDFCKRVDLRLVNKKVIETLIKAGVFDSIEQNRNRAFKNLEEIIVFVQKIKEQESVGQNSLFGDSDNTTHFHYKEIGDWENHEKIAYEKEVLGFYVSSHPLDNFKEQLEHFQAGSTLDIRDADVPEGAKIRLVGLIADLREDTIHARNNRTYSKITIKLEDYDGIVNVELFDKTADKYRSLLKMNQLIYIEGMKKTFNDNSYVSCSKLLTGDKLNQNAINEMHVKIEVIGLDEELLSQLKAKIEEHKGKVQVILHFVKPDTEGRMSIQNDKEIGVLRISDKLKCAPTTELRHFLTHQFGENCYWFDYQIS